MYSIIHYLGETTFCKFCKWMFSMPILYSVQYVYTSTASTVVYTVLYYDIQKFYFFTTEDVEQVLYSIAARLKYAFAIRKME